MEIPQTTRPLRLFYSYSHKDEAYRESMEGALKLLEHNQIIEQWSDHKILPGQSISNRIKREMEVADIIAFLISKDFIASDECEKEWEFAKELAGNTNKPIVRIPIILRQSAWEDLLHGDDLKALPNDGKPVASYSDHDYAWQEVYEGIKAVVTDLLTNFSAKVDFLAHLNETEFLSQHYINLSDLFIFPRMTCNEGIVFDQAIEEATISTEEQLSNIDYALIHGQDKSGKTSLGKYLCMSLITQSKPVLLVDMAQDGTRGNEQFLRNIYSQEFNGEYSLWKEQSNKTLIIDNMTHAKPAMDLIEMAKDVFERIVLLTSSDIYFAFFVDEQRVSEFEVMFIEPLTRNQQEELIRKRLTLTDTNRPITDGLVDQIESHVNSIIISNRIVPRYLFYVLSILQTYEAYMPHNMNITSYGHCYYVLITANLIRSGISNSDDAVNSCFNFAEQLAFTTFQQRQDNNEAPFDFDAFVSEYHNRFFIAAATINRLQDKRYGIIREDGSFRTKYMYYFFLGRFFANNAGPTAPIIEEMCEHSHIEANHLTLLFTIHHAHDNKIIDEILIRTMCALEDIPPATLTREETRRFDSVLKALPESILTTESVERQREKQRALVDTTAERSALENGKGLETEREESLSELEPVNAIYRIMRNNKVMGQILRNRYGNLEKRRIYEIIETISQSGLRLVNLVLNDEEEMTEYARYIKRQNPDWKLTRIREALNYLSFVWAMVNIEQIVAAINIPEIRESLDELVATMNVPAYDLIGYFSQLDSAAQITRREVDQVLALKKKHEDVFVRRVMSIRTQHYMNTHRSEARDEQAMCAALSVKYIHRMLPGF